MRIAASLSSRLAQLAATRTPVDNTRIVVRRSGGPCSGHATVPTMETRKVDTVLGRLHIRTSGAGDAIMFWPSLLMTGEMFTAQAEYFAPEHQVILVDPPGFGESQRLTAPFTFDDCARCIVDILDALGLECTHYVGNSWGGMVGATFAALYPDRIGSAVLMNCTGAPARARQKFEYAFLLRLAGLLGGIRPPLTRSVLKAFLGPTTFRTRPDVVAYVRDTVQRVDIHSGRWAVRSVVPARPDQRKLLSRVSTPVLVVAGAEDATFPVAESSGMAKAIPDAAIAVLEGVAHLAALESPSVVNTLIAEFLFRG
jgi:3-oxoadipate enol-lactonase